jgi:hypothetical protein
MSAKLASLSACVFILSCLSGCFSYVLNDRNKLDASSHVPIDEHSPISTTAWSTIWGGSIPVWEPLRCVHEDGSVHRVLDADKDRDCKVSKPICGAGIGRTEVSLLAYSVPLAILTLGFAMPAEITLYCSTASEADTDIQGPQ